MGEPFRLPPNLNPEQYLTFSVLAPVKTHWRQATCVEVDCPAYLKGWTTTVDESTELGQQQAYYIRHDGSRRAVETKLPSGLTEFQYEPGQQCFAAGQHKTQIKRDIFLSRGGDFRGNPTGYRRVHTKAEFWVEEFSENQDTLQTMIDKG